MASSVKKIEVSKVGACLEVLVVNAVQPNAPENYLLSNIKGVAGSFQAGVGRNGIVNPSTYPFTDRKVVEVTFGDDLPSLTFDLETVTNQPGWTLDLAGVTQAIADINSWLTTAAIPPGGATEATLISVLNAINNTQQDIEILLVRDTGNGDVVLQQITDYSGGAPVITYKDVNGNVVVPVGPLEYLDPSAVLQSMLTELLTLNTVDFATETTLGVVNTNLGTINTNVQLGNVVLSNLLTTLATEATLLDVETAIDAVKLDTAKLTAVTGVATSLLVVTGAGAASVAAGKRTVSFFNSGNADTTVNGTILKAGISITYPELANRDVYAAIPYNALTSELTITTVG